MRGWMTQRFIAVAGRLTLLPALIGAGLGATAPAAAAANPAVSLIANVGYPSWWSGACDATRWDKLAPSYGWKIDASHPGSHPLGASYLGVPVCGPRPGIDGSPDILWARPGWGEAEWECVELAQRFMAQFYGVAAYGANGDEVVKNYRPAYGGGLVTIKNGTVGIAPTPGDIISFTTPVNPWGHVTVVTASTVDGNGNGVITMMSQNDTDDGWRSLPVVNWVVQGFNTFVATAWLHDPAGRANPLADGTFVRVNGSAQVYRLAGGAPIPVTSWVPFGGVKPVTLIAPAQFSRFRTYPTDGTYLKDVTTGDAYRVAGGSPQLISPTDAALLPGWGRAQVTAVDHASIVNNAHLLPYPVNGTVVCNVSTSQCFQVVGGAPMYVPPTDTSLVTTTGVPTKISSAEFSAFDHLRQVPADGTYLCDIATTGCFETAGGAPLAISSTDATKLPGWSAATALKVSHWEFLHYAHLRVTPADGTRLCDVANGNCYVTAGGAPLYVSGTATAAVVGSSPSVAIPVSDVEFTKYVHLRLRPADGTVITGAQTGQTFVVNSGIARPQPNTGALVARSPVVVDQASIDNAGLTNQWSHLASAPSTVALSNPSARLMASGQILVAWTRPVSSSAVTSYDVRVDVANYNSAFTGWTSPATWNNITGTHLWTSQPRGADSCFQVRAHNRAGQTGPWSGISCVATAIDERFPGATYKAFTPISNNSALGHTLLRSTTRGAFWRLANVQLDRIGVMATTCPTCGSLDVYLNSSRIGTISLQSPTTQISSILTLPTFTYRSGLLTLVVSSPNGRLVQLDGVIVSRT